MRRTFRWASARQAAFHGHPFPHLCTIIWTIICGNQPDNLYFYHGEDSIFIFISCLIIAGHIKMLLPLWKNINYRFFITQKIDFTWRRKAGRSGDVRLEYAPSGRLPIGRIYCAAMRRRNVMRETGIFTYPAIIKQDINIKMLSSPY